MLIITILIIMRTRYLSLTIVANPNRIPNVLSIAWPAVIITKLSMKPNPTIGIAADKNIDRIWSEDNCSIVDFLVLVLVSITGLPSTIIVLFLWRCCFVSIKDVLFGLLVYIVFLFLETDAVDAVLFNRLEQQRFIVTLMIEGDNLVAVFIVKNVERFIVRCILGILN